MFYVLSKILDVFLSPLTWAIGLCLYTGWRAWRSKVRRARRRAWAPLAAAAILYLFAIEPVENALVRSLETEPSTMKAGVTYDAVILLGGVVDDRAMGTHGQAAYNENVERLLASYDLLRTDHARYVVPSGGAVDATRADVVEARVLGQQLADWGIAPDRIVIEDKARNTRENAVEVARIAREHGWTRLLVVTSARHMPRALDCFRAVHLDVDAYPVDYRGYDGSRFSSTWLPRASTFSESCGAVREWAGRAIYRIRGYGSS